MYYLLSILVLFDVGCETFASNLPFGANINDFPEMSNQTRRIFLGRTVTQDMKEYAFVAAIYLPYKVPMPHADYSFCTGSILSTYYILTAAHCLYKYPTTTSNLIDGDIDMTTSYADVGYFYYDSDLPHVPLVAALLYPDFVTHDAWIHDIMLLKSKNNLLEGRTTSAAVLPMYHEVPPYKSRVQVIGWGHVDFYDKVSTDVLQIGEQYVMYPTYCLGPHQVKAINYGILICTGDPYKNGSFVRGGDSGGPLMWEGKVVGVTSFSDQTDESGFTNVVAYRDWILSSMQGFTSKPLVPVYLPNVTIDEFPYLARLSFYLERHNHFLTHTVCTGSVIAANTILTAARCLFAEHTLTMDFNVSASFANVGFDVLHTGSLKEYTFKYFRVHPDYDPLSNRANVAIVVTKDDPLANPEVEPIRIGLPTNVGDVGNQVLVPAYFNVIEKGLGQFEIDGDGEHGRYLQKGFFEIKPTFHCNLKPTDPLNNTGMLCLQNDNKYPFNGDVGSPVMLNGVVTGIVSYAFGRTLGIHSVAVAMDFSIYGWLDRTAWKSSSLPFPCDDLRSTLLRDKDKKLLNIDHMWELFWIIPVCKSEKVNFAWNEAKHVAKITLVKFDGTYKLCSGAFVSSSVVLTSANCVLKPGKLVQDELVHTIVISTGFVRLTSDYYKYSGAEHVLVHPDYNPATLIADLALVVMLYTENQMPVVSINIAKNDHNIAIGAKVDLWGWGQKDPHDYYNILRKLEFTVAPIETCADMYVGREDIVEHSFFCITSDPAEFTYEGDQGAPAVYVNAEVVGVLSEYNILKNQGYALVTRVPTRYEWLDRIINKKFEIKTYPCRQILDILDRDRSNPLKYKDDLWQLDGVVPDCGDSPFMAKIRLRQTNDTLIASCAGAIIRPYWVLGSAHCWWDGHTEVISEIAGSIIVVYDKKNYYHPVKKIVPHFEYVAAERLNDLCLYETQSDLTQGDNFINVISITPISTSHEEMGNNLKIFGYRYKYTPNVEEATEELMVYSNVLKLFDCNFWLSRKQPPPTMTVSPLHKFCVQNHTEFKHEEPQGPLVYQQTLLGMVSWGDGPIVMTNVSSYIDWLENITSSIAH